MDKRELADRLARQTHCSKAAAADDLDRTVHNILASLRRGERARLPGLGTFVPGGETGVAFEADAAEQEDRS